MVEGTRLENEQRFKRPFVGSNPTLSVSKRPIVKRHDDHLPFRNRAYCIWINQYRRSSLQCHLHSRKVYGTIEGGGNHVRYFWRIHTLGRGVPHHLRPLFPLGPCVWMGWGGHRSRRSGLLSHSARRDVFYKNTSIREAYLPPLHFQIRSTRTRSPSNISSPGSIRASALACTNLDIVPAD